MCTSCLSYLLNNVISLERNHDEEVMLWDANPVRENSCLACQILITKAMNGLKLEIAPE